MLVPAILLVAERLSRRGSGDDGAPDRGKFAGIGNHYCRRVCFCHCAGRTGYLAGFTLRADPAAHLGGVAFRTERNQRGHVIDHV